MINIGHIMLPLRHSEFTANAIDDPFAISHCLHTLQRVAHFQRGVAKLMQNHESQVECFQRFPFSAQMSEIGEVDLDRRRFDLLVRPPALEYGAWSYPRENHL